MRWLRAILRQRGALRWCAEIAGVMLIAGAVATWQVQVGAAIIGVYAIIVANTGRD